MGCYIDCVMPVYLVNAADGGERCSLTMSQSRGNADVSTMGGRCNESREPLQLASIHPLGLLACPVRKVDSCIWQGLVLKHAERSWLVLHDERAGKPTGRACGLDVALASCPTRQEMLLISVN